MYRAAWRKVRSGGLLPGEAPTRRQGSDIPGNNVGLGIKVSFGGSMAGKDENKAKDSRGRVSRVQVTDSWTDQGGFPTRAGCGSYRRSPGVEGPQARAPVPPGCPTPHYIIDRSRRSISFLGKAPTWRLTNCPPLKNSIVGMLWI